MRSTRKLVALATIIVLATPFGTPAVLEFIQNHVNVPFVRDCHGFRPHHSECHHTASVHSHE
jgi:hypothetical protein